MGLHKIATSTVDWTTIREDFPILREQAHGHPLIYFDSQVSAAHSCEDLEFATNAFAEVNEELAK
jgi:cysteine desulfurase/selenocysteine lyase